MEGAEKVSFELDNLLKASAVSASILDIIAASGSLALPNKLVAEEDEAGGSKIVADDLDGLFENPCGAGSASGLDIATASGSRALPGEGSAEEGGFSGEDQGSLAAVNAASSTRQTFNIFGLKYL